MRLGEPVREVLFEGKRAVGVRTDAGTRRHDALVVNADFAHAMRHLVPDGLRRRWTDRKLEGKTFSCSTFMLYLGLEGTQEDVSHHTIYLSEDYRRNVSEIEDGARRRPTRPSTCRTPASPTPRWRPPGTPRSTCWCPWATGTARASTGRARRRASGRRRWSGSGASACTDVERRIRFEKQLTPTDWEGDMAIHRGATFNLAHSLDQMLHRRPRNRFEDMDGVYLVGGGTHPGSGLPVIFESARITARLMAEDLGLDPHWSAPSTMAAPTYEPAIAEAL